MKGKLTIEQKREILKNLIESIPEESLDNLLVLMRLGLI
jgi:Ca2+-binding EF-hand superfamily protein